MLLAVLGALPAAAKPLVTSSEETPARLCLQFEEEPERLVGLCRDAIARGDLTRAEKSDLLTKLGDALFMTPDLDEAETVYREALEADPGNVEPLNGLGWLYWEQDAMERAVAMFEESIALRPTASGLGGLAGAKRRLDAIPAGEAVQMLDAALAIDPEYQWALREKGWILLEDGRADEAASSFKKAMDLDEWDWNAHYGYSRAQTDLYNYEDALVALGRAIEIDPTEPWGFGQRAFVLRMLDRNAQAIKDADRMIAMRPDDSMGYGQKALAQEALGRRKAAFGTFQAGVDAGAADGFLLYWFADVLSDDGQMDRARDVIDRAIKDDLSDPYNHQLKAYIALRQDDFETSVAAADRALELDASLVYAHYYAAAALVYSGAHDEGIARFDRGMKAGLDEDAVGSFVTDLISVGKYVEAIKLRARY